MKDAVAINAISGAPVDGRLYIQLSQKRDTRGGCKDPDGVP